MQAHTGKVWQCRRICREHLPPAADLLPALAMLVLSPVAMARLRSSPISSQLLSIENLLGAALPEEEAPRSDSTADPLGGKATGQKASFNNQVAKENCAAFPILGVD